MNQGDLEHRNGRVEQEAGEAAASRWWVGNSEGTRADLGAFPVCDHLDLDGKT